MAIVVAALVIAVVVAAMAVATMATMVAIWSARQLSRLQFAGDIVWTLPHKLQ
jgi:hypothetical protein